MLIKLSCSKSQPASNDFFPSLLLMFGKYAQYKRCQVKLPQDILEIPAPAAYSNIKEVSFWSYSLIILELLEGYSSVWNKASLHWHGEVQFNPLWKLVPQSYILENCWKPLCFWWKLVINSTGADHATGSVSTTPSHIFWFLGIPSDNGRSRL